jgi:hypothetical protein
MQGPLIGFLDDFFRKAVPCMTGRTLARPLRGLISALRAEKSLFDFAHALKVHPYGQQGSEKARRGRG